MMLSLFNAVAETVTDFEAAEPITDFAERSASGSPFAVSSGPLLIVIIIALIVALVVVSSFKAQMKTAAKKTGAKDYAQRDTFRLDRQSDYFLYESVQKRPIQTNNAPRQGGNAPEKK